MSINNSSLKLTPQSTFTTIGQTTVQPPYQSEDNNANGLLLASIPIALLIFGSIGLIWFINSFLCICKPNEVVILTGRKRQTKEGHEVGYHVFSGGRVK